MTYEQEQKLIEAVRNDSFYQELLRQCKALEPEYCRILAALPETDRDILDRYISACEGLEYQRTCIVLTL